MAQFVILEEVNSAKKRVYDTCYNKHAAMAACERLCKLFGEKFSYDLAENWPVS